MSDDPRPGGQAPKETPAERRVDHVGREAFELAVISATKSATQTIARMHRVRLVTWSAVTAFAGACVVFAVAAAVLYSVARSVDLGNARYNCHVLTRVTQIMGNGAPDLTLDGKPEGFLSSELLLRTTQNRLNDKARLAPGPLRTLLNDPQTAALERQVLAANTKVTDYWANTLVTALDQVAGTNCRAAVR